MARNPTARARILVDDDTRRGINSAVRSMRTMRNSLRGVGAALGVGITAETARRIIRTTDQYSVLSRRIRTAAQETGAFITVQDSLTQTAVETGTQLEAAVGVFQQLSRVQQDIGATREEMLDFNATVARLGVIGGTSTQAINFSMRQLTQGLAQGTFRAEEFNSVVENTPEIAREIALSLGVTQGRLRQMVITGELLSTDVFEGILERTEAIEERFKEIPNEIGRSFQSLSTAIGTAFARIGERTGLTQNLADALTFLANSILAVTEIPLAERILAQADPTITTLEEIRRAYESVGLEIERLAKIADDPNLRPGAREGFEQDIRNQQDLAAGLAKLAFEVEKLEKAAEDASVPITKLFGEDVLTGADLTARRIQLAQEQFEAEKQQRAEIFKDEVAQAAGFANEAARLGFEQSEQLFAAKMDNLRSQNEAEIALELGFKRTRDLEIANLERAHQEQLLTIRFLGNRQLAKATTDIANFETATVKQKTATILGLGQALTAGLAQQSRTAFNINKAFAIAEAAISGGVAVAHALETRPFVPVGLAMAAVAAAMTASNIASIASTSFGGASSGLTSRGPGTGIPSLAGQGVIPAPPIVTADDRANRLDVTITVEGTDELSRALSRSVRTEIVEFDEVIAPAGSRQALELAR